MGVILSVKNIACGYQDVEVLSGISFEVEEHERFCVLGPNGCGKTTLLRAINRQLSFSGEISACGRDIKNMRRKDLAKTMVCMSQMNTVYFPYTVYETVRLGRYAHSKGLFQEAKEDDDIVEESLRQTGMWEYRDRTLSELSGGQFQRVMLSRVFAQTPDIILLDEPTNHLDLKYQLELMEHLDRWVRQERHCVVSVLHDVRMALSFSDKILLLQDGKSVYCGATKQFPKEQLNSVYGMDICAYMKKSAEIF